MWVLMTGRKKFAYTSVFNYINQEFPDFVPNFCMCDYEPALHNALKANFPQIKIVGCYFHHTKVS